MVVGLFKSKSKSDSHHSDAMYYVFDGSCKVKITDLLQKIFLD